MITMAEVLQDVSPMGLKNNQSRMYELMGDYRYEGADMLRLLLGAFWIHFGRRIPDEF